MVIDYFYSNNMVPLFLKLGIYNIRVYMYVMWGCAGYHFTGFNWIVNYQIPDILDSRHEVREWHENTIVSVVYSWNLNKTCTVCVSIDLNKTGTSLVVYKWRRGSSNQSNMIYHSSVFPPVSPTSKTEILFGNIIPDSRILSGTSLN